MSGRRAVVIGSGLSGLSSAILLAEGGWSVTVLERHSIPGGLMQRYRRGRLHLDVGFHLATDGGPHGILRAILARLGTAGRHVFLAPDPEAAYEIAWPGAAPLRVPDGMAGVEAATAARWPDQAAAIARFFARLRGELAANPWLRHLAGGAAPEPVGMAPTVAGVLADCGVEGEPAMVLGAASAILAMRAERCPFHLYAGFAGTSFAGGWRLAGGGDGLAGPLVERLRGLGATLALRCPAARIEHDGQHARAVVDGAGSRHEADLVVAGIHPDEVRRLVGDDGLRPSLRERLDRIPDGDGAFLLALELDRPLVEAGRRHHLFRLADGGDAYLVAPDRWEDGLPPCIEAMVWVPVAETAPWRASVLGRRPGGYAAWKEAQAARLLAGLAQRFPDLPGRVVRRWTASPLTFRDYTGGRDGGAMGLSHDAGHLGDAPIPPRSKLRNLLLCGQNVHHPGIVGCLIGGCLTAGMVLGRDLLAEVQAHRGG
jgi:all-trans-retinol 13,14-reductase